MTTETAEEPTGVDEPTEHAVASQWTLMVWKFRRHRLAVASTVLVVLLYLTAAFCEFLAPYPAQYRDSHRVYAPPQRLHLHDPATGLHWRPFVYALKAERDPVTLRRHYVEDRTRLYPVRFFVRGEPYKFWGLIPMERHLLGTDAGGSLHLLGTDAMGQDLFSRILYGARVSLTIGLIGVVLSFYLGMLIGAISGYYGGWVDDFIQRLVEILRSFPQIPLWMGLSAALPAHWSPIKTYLGITVVLSLIGWTGLARVVRGRLLAMREEDFVIAAELSGASTWRILWKHMLPSFMSHIIVSLTLAVPGMILAETALSFLGLGLKNPVASWGVLLGETKKLEVVALHPWLLTPALFVILAVLAFNFIGDGLRDAADPYSR